jgi:ArsR family transcriptional regulator
MSRNQTKSCCVPKTRSEPELPVTGAAADEDLARLTKALGHPARVQIVKMLAKRDSCVCGEIADAFPLAQSTVSQHLKILKEAGLIQGEVDGPRVCYCVSPASLARLKSLVAAI